MGPQASFLSLSSLEKYHCYPSLLFNRIFLFIHYSLSIYTPSKELPSCIRFLLLSLFSLFSQVSSYTQQKRNTKTKRNETKEGRALNSPCLNSLSMMDSAWINHCSLDLNLNMGPPRNNTDPPVICKFLSCTNCRKITKEEFPRSCIGIHIFIDWLIFSYLSFNQKNVLKRPMMHVVEENFLAPKQEVSIFLYILSFNWK